MAHASWLIDQDGDLKLIINYQKQNETSSGTSGCSTSWYKPITTLEKTAKTLLEMAGKSFILSRVTGKEDWVKLRDAV